MENTNENVEVTATVTNSGSKGKSIVGMAMTIVGLVLSWMGLCGGFPGFLSIAVIIVGLLLAKADPFKKVAKICGIIGIVISALATLAGFILLIAGIGSIFA